MNAYQINIPAKSWCQEQLQDDFNIESSQEIFRPNQSPRKSKNLFRCKVRKNKKMSKFNQSLWTLKENTAYKSFLEANGHLFDQNRQGRKRIKINVLMSNAVKSRSADQCRSHHQKMMKYHRCISQIINHIQRLVVSTDDADDNETLVRTPNNQVEPELIDFTEYEGMGNFSNQERDLVEEFLTFSR